MKRIMQLSVLLILVSCSVASFFISTAAETAINHAADYAERPLSATEMIMKSRQTAPEETNNKALPIIGFLAIAALIAVGIILGLSNGGEFLRQLRLTTRGQRRRQYRPQAQEVPQIRTVPRVQQLPNYDQDFPSS